MNLTVVNELCDTDIDQLMDLYANEFWCSNRCKDDVVKMLANTDVVVGVKTEDGVLIGFARVLTDFVYKATFYDVIVHPNWRSNNIGKMLMELIISHNKLENVEHFDLNCLPSMYPFYELWGFTAEVGGLGFMRKLNRHGGE